MSDENIPLVCTLTPPELQQRRREILDRLAPHLQESRELSNGCAYRFATEESLLAELAEIVTLERRCCPFLRFTLICEPGQGPLWLEITGPEGTKEFLKDLLG